MEKYKKIVDKKLNKYGSCNTILIREVLGKDAVILIQNAFPTIEKYIDHVYTFKGVPARVSDALKQEY